MLELNNTTLLSICRKEDIEKTEKAKDKCLSFAKFNKSVIITDNISKITEVQYNQICINYLKNLVKTDFVLLFQWDGFIIDPTYWTDEFFEYDYIGAPWGFPEAKNRIGNGGFCLRSRKFLEVCSTIEYTPYECDWLLPVQKLGRPIAPEDWFMCYGKYEYLIENGIKFPSVDLAYQFSVEHPTKQKAFDRDKIETYKSFGFHGDFNTAAMELL